MINAKDRNITETSVLPQVSSAITSWFQVCTFQRITRTLVNFQTVETIENMSYVGFRVPMAHQQLMLKPEGERCKKWETIFALPDLVLNLNDIIVFGNVKYRVMEKYDWKEYGYVSYNIVRDFEAGAND